MKFFLTFLFLLSFFGTRVDAQTDAWSELSGEAQVCNSAGQCVTMVCAPEGKISLVVNGGGLFPGPGRLDVDGQAIGQGNFGGSQGFPAIALDPRVNAPILARMKTGSRLAVHVQGGRIEVTLRGSSEALDRLVSTCISPKPVVTQAASVSSHRRFADESSVEIDPAALDLPRNAFTMTRDADLWGGDLRSGLNDPLLAGVTEDQCAALCLATQKCGAFTFNRTNGKTCFLKTGGGRLTRFSGATTGILNRQHLDIPPPPTRGPATLLDNGVRWREGDTEQPHLSGPI